MPLKFIDICNEVPGPIEDIPTCVIDLETYTPGDHEDLLLQDAINTMLFRHSPKTLLKFYEMVSGTIEIVPKENNPSVHMFMLVKGKNRILVGTLECRNGKDPNWQELLYYKIDSEGWKPHFGEFGYLSDDTVGHWSASDIEDIPPWAEKNQGVLSQKSRMMAQFVLENKIWDESTHHFKFQVDDPTDQPVAPPDA